MSCWEASCIVAGRREGRAPTSSTVLSLCSTRWMEGRRSCVLEGVRETSREKGRGEKERGRRVREEEKGSGREEEKGRGGEEDKGTGKEEEREREKGGERGKGREREREGDKERLKLLVSARHSTPTSCQV